MTARLLGVTIISCGLTVASDRRVPAVGSAAARHLKKVSGWSFGKVLEGEFWKSLKVQLRKGQDFKRASRLRNTGRSPCAEGEFWKSATACAGANEGEYNVVRCPGCLQRSWQALNS